MKKKKINTLKIKKEVIANLDNPAMSELKGGTDWFTRQATYCDAMTCPTGTCPTYGGTGYGVCLCNATLFCCNVPGSGTFDVVLTI